MNCPEYLELTAMEKSMVIGEIVHCLQNDSAIFKSCKQLIKLGNQKGLFDHVTIMPETPGRHDENQLNQLT